MPAEKRKDENIRSQLITAKGHCITAVFLLLLLVLLTIASVRMVRWHKKTSTTLSTSLPLATSPSSSQSDLPEYKRQDRLLVGVNDNLLQLNPLFATGDGEIDVVSLVFQSLARFDAQGDLQAQLAKDWSYNPKTSSLTVHLRRDHTFRDGRVVGVEDVIYTYKCLLSPAYDGPLSGRLTGLEAVLAGPDEQTVIFQFSSGADEPDLALLTAGILKADYYPYEPERIFELKDSNLLPEGSGSFYVKEQTGNHVELELRNGYAGQINTIEIRQIASEAKYRLLLENQLDLIRNSWDDRMQQRALTLPDYSFHPVTTSPESYFLLNPQPLPQSKLQHPQQRLALLTLATGQNLTAEQESALTQLKNVQLILYYFQGVDAEVRYKNRQQADDLAALLGGAGLNISSKALAWPEMAERAANHNYDLMLFPATANSRLPHGARPFKNSSQADATALAYSYRSEVIIVSKRLEQLTINPYAHPYAATVASWTDRVENIRIRQKDQPGEEDESE